MDAQRRAWTTLAACALGCGLCAIGGAPAAAFEIGTLAQAADDGGDGELALYDALLRDLTVALAPALSGPTGTGGPLGAHIGYGYGWFDVDRTARHWQLVGAEDSLGAHQLNLRKGLPAGLQLGATLSRIAALDAWDVSAALKLAFLEGEAVAPDVALRVSAGGLAGSPELALVHGGAELLVGKRFAVAGVVQLTPWVGYALGIGWAEQRTLGVVRAGAVRATGVTLPARVVVTHRGLIGVAATWGLIELGLQVGFGTLTSVGVEVGVRL